MTTCKRYYRNCNEFGICVNIGKKGYVLAEEPTERKTIFQYGIYGIRGDNLKLLLEYILDNNIPIADRVFDRTFQD